MSKWFGPRHRRPYGTATVGQWAVFDSVAHPTPPAAAYDPLWVHVEGVIIGYNDGRDMYRVRLPDGSHRGVPAEWLRAVGNQDGGS